MCVGQIANSIMSRGSHDSVTHRDSQHGVLSVSVARSLLYHVYHRIMLTMEAQCLYHVGRGDVIECNDSVIIAFRF